MAEPQVPTPEDETLQVRAALGLPNTATLDEVLFAVASLVNTQDVARTQHELIGQLEHWMKKIRQAADVGPQSDVDELLARIRVLADAEQRYEDTLKLRDNAESGRGGQIRAALGLAQTAPHEAVVQLCHRMREKARRLEGPELRRSLAVQEALDLLHRHEDTLVLDDVVVLADWLLTGDSQTATAVIQAMRERHPAQPPISDDAASWSKADDV